MTPTGNWLLPAVGHTWTATNPRVLLLLSCLLYVLLPTATASAQLIEVSGKPSPTNFALVENVPSDLIIDTEDHAVVEIVATLFSHDIERVTGRKPEILKEIRSTAKRVVLIGTLDSSQHIDALVRSQKLDVSAIRGKWESFLITTIKNPFENANCEEALVIVGSDRRGTAYGVLTLSESIGVSPWYYWADVPTSRKEQLHVSRKEFTQGPSPIKYRGIFINDEDWGLHPWAAKNIDTELQDIGPKTYAKIFELMLRLKANYLWPGMHKCTRAFNSYTQNKLLADNYAIVMGASHCEPMLRNNVTEWNTKSMGEWDYKINRDNIYAYWESRVKQNAKFENLFTVGMRGIHDSKMPGGGTLHEKRIRLEGIIRDQRNIIAQHVNSDVTQVPQIFCPYKEVLEIYEDGMDLPEDVTLVWPDDNFGYIRNLPNPNERQRSGGSGIYYHMSYWGWPQDYLWIGSTSPALIAYELQKAYAYGADRLWIFNVGDIKPLELEMDFALRLAYKPDQWPAEKAMDFISSWASRNFGNEYSEEIAQIFRVYYQLTHQAKPEHIDRVEFTKPEQDWRLDQYTKISRQAQKVFESIEPEYRDSFFQLVLYPVQCADLMNQKHTSAIRGNTMKAVQAYEKIQQLTHRYNTEIANGKWDGMMNGAPRDTSVFQRPKRSLASYRSQPPLLELAITRAKLGGSMRLTDEGLCASTPGIQPENNSSKARLEFEHTTHQKADLYFLAKCRNDKQDSWYVSLNGKKTLSNNQPTGERFEWIPIMQVALQEGRNELVISQREPNAIIQRIMLVRPGQKPHEALRTPDHVISSADYHLANNTETSNWVEVQGLGIERSAMTLLPHESIPISKSEVEIAPSITYRFQSDANACLVESRFLPTHRINSAASLRFALQVDGGPIKIQDLNSAEGSRPWSENVLRGFSKGETVHALVDSRSHEIKLYLLDPGMVLSQIRVHELN